MPALIATNWAAWIEAVSTGVATVVVIATAGFAVVSLRDATRTRHAVLMSEIARQWVEPRVIESLELHVDYRDEGRLSALVDRLFGPNSGKPSQQDVKDWSTLTIRVNLLDWLGILASEKALSANVIYKMWGSGILTAWSLWEEPIDKLRRYEGRPGTYEYFEEIASSMREISRRELQEAAERRADASVAT